MACKDYSQFKLPPGTVPSGTNVVVIDGAGAHKILTNPASAGLLYFNGSTFSWATGAEGDRVKLPNLKTNNHTAVLAGFMGIGGDGGIQRVVNTTAEELTLLSKDGILYWGYGVEQHTLPETPYSGFLKRVAGDISWDTEVGVKYIDEGLSPATAPLGAKGSVLKMVGNFPGLYPAFVPETNASLLSGAVTADMSGVVVRSASNETAVGIVPMYRLTDGSGGTNEGILTVAGGTFTWDILTGMDEGTASPNAWHYGYIVSDGITSSAVVSLNPVVPNLGGSNIYYGLVTVFRVNADLDIIPFIQVNRKFSIKPQSLGSGLQAGTGYAEIGLTTPIGSVAPPVAKSVSGTVGSANGSTLNDPMKIASSIDGIGAQALYGWSEFTGAFDGFFGGTSSFHDIAFADPAAPKLYWMAKNFTIDRKLELNGYTI